MRCLYKLPLRLRSRFRRPSVEQDLSEELRFHLEKQIEEQLGQAVAPEEARYAALRQMGGLEQIKEECRDMRRVNLFENLVQDVRYGLRMLAKSPGFTLLAALSLALGLGSNAAIFSLVSGLLFKPLPYPEPDRLVRVTDYYPQGALTALQEQSRTMDIAGFTTDAEFNLTEQGEAMRVLGSSVSSNLFVVLQTGSELGRIFRPGEDRPGQDAIVLLSHALWQKKFAGDPGIIGRIIKVDGVDREVTGVMPPDFAFPSPEAQLWLPLHIDSRDVFATWNRGFMPLVARLHPGATFGQARQELHPLISRIIPLFPYSMFRSWNADATVIPLQQALIGDFRDKLVVLQFAVGLVLLIACANVAGLLLSRAAARQKEIALRTALGAGRGRIIRQLLTESIVLALAGAGLGLLFALITLSDFKHLLPPSAPGLAQVQMDWQVAGFMAIGALLAGLACGLVPALSASKLDLAVSIKAGGRRPTGATSARLRGILIAGEVALAVILAAGAGLLIKSLWGLAKVNPGFSPEQVLTARITPDQHQCQQRSACVALYDELLRRVRGINGVSDVAAVNALPLSGETPFIPAEIEGHPIDAAAESGPDLLAGAVTPEYFALMHIPILQGRGFTEADNERSSLSVVLSAATARKFWPGDDPIGKHIRTLWSAHDPWRVVVGVAGDVRQYSLDNQAPAWLAGAVYVPYAQAQAVDNMGQLPTAMELLVRTGRDTTAVANRIREVVRVLNPNVPVSDVRTMSEVVSGSTSQPRSMMWLFAGFAALALFLSAIGTYGVVSYSTSQRTFEIGIRMTLGESRASIFGLVLGQSIKLVLAGLAVGTVAALALTRMLNAFLYGIKPTDPLTFLAVAGLLVGIALLAGYLPARRATRIGPMEALRHE